MPGKENETQDKKEEIEIEVETEDEKKKDEEASVELESFKNSIKEELLDDFKINPYLPKFTSFTYDKPKSFKERINDVKIKNWEIKNKELLINIILKACTLVVLFLFLWWETDKIFNLALLQGQQDNNFELDEWSFRAMISATILEVTAMLFIAVKHLFPTDKNKKKN